MAAAVLIVDDDAASLDALTIGLNDAGYSAVPAGSLNEALTILGHQSVDLIIADTMDPHWNPELPSIRQLQAATRSTPIILHTAYAGAEWLDADREKLAAVWMKPLPLGLLLEGIQATLRQSPRPSTARVQSA